MCLRLHSIERVTAELEYIAEHHKRTGEPFPVSIHDDAFTLLPRAKALCQVGSRCAFFHSGSMDRTSLVSPAGEPSDYAGYWVVSWETISLTRRLGRAVRRTTQPKQPGQRLSKDSAVTPQTPPDLLD